LRSGRAVLGTARQPSAGGMSRAFVTQARSPPRFDEQDRENSRLSTGSSAGAFEEQHRDQRPLIRPVETKCSQGSHSSIPNGDGEDCEEGDSAEEVGYVRARRFAPLAKGALGLGAALTFLACVMLYTGRKAATDHAARPGHPGNDVLPDLIGDLGVKGVVSARSLLESQDFAEVASANALAMSGRSGDSERGALTAEAREGFKRISASIGARFPETAVQLETIQLSEEQKDAVLSSLRHLSDPRVQKLGFEVAQVMHKGGGRDAVDRRLHDYFQPRLESIRRLRDEVIPESLRSSESEELQGEEELTIDTEGMRFVESYHEWNWEMDMAQPEVSKVSEAVDAAPPVSRRLSKGGKGGKGDGKMSLLDQMTLMTHVLEFFERLKKVAKKFGINLPDMEKALKEVNVENLLNCVASQMLSRNPMSMLKCGVQFAQTAMEVLKSLGSQTSKGSKGSSKGGKGGKGR